MDRGVLEASQLKAAFLRLEEENGGPITTVQALLKWTVIASAIKEGVVSFAASQRRGACSLNNIDKVLGP